MSLLTNGWDDNQPTLTPEKTRRRQENMYDEMRRREKDLQIIPVEEEQDKGPISPPPSWEEIRHIDIIPAKTPYLH